MTTYKNGRLINDLAIKHSTRMNISLDTTMYNIGIIIDKQTTFEDWYLNFIKKENELKLIFAGMLIELLRRK